MSRATAVVSLLLLAPTGLGAQSLVQRVAAIGEGTLHLSFAARPGVCGNGTNGITVSDGNDEWEGECERGPVRVSLRVVHGSIAEAHTYVGGRWRGGGPATDLGTLAAAAAAADLLTLAERAEGDGGDLISAATFADSIVVWPRLLDLARKPSIAIETRRQAIFWLGQAASTAATRGLDSIAGDSGDIEIRKQAVFALSERPGDEGVPALIRIARSNRYGEVRKQALFWLAQSDDPRAVALFEDLLR